MKYFVFCALLSLIYGSLSIAIENATPNGKLIFAHILYRHGDRTPVDTYPTDPWKNINDWPTTWGQLTNIGKSQHYELGKWLSKRYSSLLNDTYSTNSIHIQSTDVDRTLMSAQSNLAGMFQPTGNEIWNKDIAWQPIPIHTMPETDDYILAGKKSCPAYDYQFRKLKESKEFKRFDSQFDYLYRYLTKYTGRNINSLEAVQRINNTLSIETIYNKTLPKWTQKVFPGGDMQFISDFSFAVLTYTRPLARLKSGPLLKEILTRFQDKANGNLHPDRSVWVYSAHDTTVANLLNILKLFKLHSPPYMACILMEMRMYNDVPYISIFYKNTTSEPVPMIIPDCGTSCPLTKLFNLYEDVLPIDWASECKMSMLSMTYEEADFNSAMAILACTTTMVLLFLSLYMVILYFRRRSVFKKHYYVQVD